MNSEYKTATLTTTLELDNFNSISTIPKWATSPKYNYIQLDKLIYKDDKQMKFDFKEEIMIIHKCDFCGEEIKRDEEGKLGWKISVGRIDTPGLSTPKVTELCDKCFNKVHKIELEKLKEE